MYIYICTLKNILNLYFVFVSVSNGREHLVEKNLGNISSAPLQSPANAIDMCSVTSAMTRSRSLNSPLVSGATGTCQHMDQAASTRHKRRHSGMYIINFK